jgi:2-hydroxychromene-2-carboxylate isomerase
MKPIVFWFDPISPYAYLAFERLPQALEGCSYLVEYRPVLLAGLLKHWGQLGPAEIGPKRNWTYRQVGWLARRQGTTLELPRPHPFNPLALLRLALASAPAGRMPNRYVVERLFAHVWQHAGQDPNDPARLAALQAAIAPARDPQSDELKQELRALTQQAIEAGVFGVPSFVLDDRLFWGADALPMLRAALEGDAWIHGPEWDAAGRQPSGSRRTG